MADLAINNIKHMVRRARLLFRRYSFLLDDNILDNLMKKREDLTMKRDAMQNAVDDAQKQEVGERDSPQNAVDDAQKQEVGERDRPQNAVDDAQKQEVGERDSPQNAVDDAQKQEVGERDRLQNAVDDAQKQEAGERARSWLTKVEELLEDVQGLEKEIQESKKGFNCCLSWSQRHRLGKKVKETIYSINELEETGHLLWLGLRKINLFLSNEFVVSRSSLRAAKSIVEFLTDDSINVFVLWGDSWVGKTTLVKEFGMQAKKWKIVQKVVMIAVSQPLDIEDIQGQIADSLNLKLEEAPVEDRATKLRWMLKRKKRILLIVTDVPEEPNWQKIGIPYGEDQKGCKILVTTHTDHKSFMSNPRCSLERLKVFTDDEACDLFRKKAGLGRDTCTEIKKVADKIAKECLGLPMVIITLGSALRGKSNLDEWKRALKELQDGQKKKELQDSKEVDAHVYRSLKLSFDLLQNDDTRKCLLLCSLFVQDSGIDVEDVVRYAFGLGLFEDHLTIEDTRTRISAAIDILKASLLLLDYNGERKVKMPKMIHDAALLIASKEENSFLIRSEFGLKKWPRNETLEPCMAVSLLDAKIKNLPDQGLKSEKLKILLLGGEGCMSVSSTFLEGLNKLQVFSLHDGLLSSDALQHVINLRALHLEGCKLNGISSLGMLKELEILSFCKSNIIKLPKEIGELNNLRLLDLSECQQLREIHPDLIQKLSKLEELYLGGLIFEGWELGKTSEGRSSASLSELKSLSNLSILFLEVRSSHVPKDFVFPKLHKYQIGVNDDGKSNYYYPTSRTLKISQSSLNAFQTLFQNVQYLHLSSLTSYQNLMPILDRGGLNELVSLELGHCPDMECIIETTMQQVSALEFSKLEKLVIEEMVSLKELCKGLPSKSSFPKLQMLTVRKCPNMISAVLIVESLKELILEECCKLAMVFQINEHEENQLLSNLTHLELKELPELKCIWSGPSQNVTLPALKVLKVKHCSVLTSIFTPSIAQSLENLEELQIEGCCSLEQIITKMEDATHLNPPCLPQLKTLKVTDCSLLEYIFPITTVAVFPNLTVLVVSKSLQLKRVFHIEKEMKGNSIEPPKKEGDSIELRKKEDDSIELPKKEHDKLPKLQRLALKGLPNLSSFCQGMVSISIPSLQKLEVEECPQLTPFTVRAEERMQVKELRLSKLENNNFPGNTFVSELRERLPNSEAIFVGNLVEIFQLQGGYFLSNLRKLILEDLSELYFLWGMGDSRHQIVTLQNLTSLQLIGCKKIRCIFSAQITRNLPKLSCIVIRGCDNLSQIINPELPYLPSSSKVHAEFIRFPKLNQISVEKCNKLESLFPVSLASCFPRLEKLEVKEAPELKQIFKLEGVPYGNGKRQMELPQLKVLILEDLPNLISFIPVGYSFKFSSLDSLKVINCEKMVTSFTCQVGRNFDTSESYKHVFAETEESLLPKDHMLSGTLTVQKIEAVAEKGIEWHRNEQN